MSGEKELLLSLPLDNKEREWMKERLRTLSVREEYQLAAAVWRSDRLSRLASQDRDERLESVLRQKPEDLAREAVNCLLSLEEYNVLCPAGSYESLGECYLKYYTDIPPEAWLFMDLEQIGENYESCHPGLFIGDCYVSYPRQEPEQLYRGTDLESLPKGDWSLRLRLASPANPEGIWLRLPDYSREIFRVKDQITGAFNILLNGFITSGIDKNCYFTILYTQGRAPANSIFSVSFTKLSTSRTPFPNEI